MMHDDILPEFIFIPFNHDYQFIDSNRDEELVQIDYCINLYTLKILHLVVCKKKLFWDLRFGNELKCMMLLF